MTCVRCGDTKKWHCKGDGSNIRNAACPAFLEKWPAESAPTMTFSVASVEVVEADKKAE